MRAIGCGRIAPRSAPEASNDASGDFPVGITPSDVSESAAGTMLYTAGGSVFPIIAEDPVGLSPHSAHEVRLDGHLQHRNHIYGSERVLRRIVGLRGLDAYHRMQYLGLVRLAELMGMGFRRILWQQERGARAPPMTVPGQQS